MCVYANQMCAFVLLNRYFTALFVPKPTYNLHFIVSFYLFYTVSCSLEVKKCFLFKTEMYFKEWTLD